MTVRAGSGKDQNGKVVITLQSGARVESSMDWTFTERANITAVEPSEGQHGSLVKIAGTGEPFSARGVNIRSVHLAGVLVDAVVQTASEDGILAVPEIASKHRAMHTQENTAYIGKYSIHTPGPCSQ